MTIQTEFVERTWRAFWMVTIEDHSSQLVSQELVRGGMSITLKKQDL